MELAALPVKLDVKENSFIIKKSNKTDQVIDITPVENINMFYASLDDDKLKDNKGKWIVGGEFSPLYSYRLISYSTAATSDYYNQVESPLNSYTGGVNIQYKKNKRLSIQTGVYYASMGQSLDYLSVYANQAYSLVSVNHKSQYIHNYELENSVGTVVLNSPYVVVDNRGNRISDIGSNKAYFDISDPIFQDLQAEIQQNFQYLEVPVVLRYKLIDRLIDFNFIGGLGANFLIGNNIYLVQGNAREVVGETKDINNLNISGNIGLGIEYPLMKNIQIRLEPSIKYYINAINRNSSYKSHPYALGVYTGISYSF